MSANIASVDKGSLDAPLDEEASEFVGAERYEMAAGRDAYHSSRYARRLVTGVGEIELSAKALRDGRGDDARQVRRDAGLHGIPAGALVPDQDEQRDRAHQPRDQEEDEGRREIPGRQLGPHAGDGETEVHSGTREGQEEILGHVQA